MSSRPTDRRGRTTSARRLWPPQNPCRACLSCQFLPLSESCSASCHHGLKVQRRPRAQDAVRAWTAARRVHAYLGTPRPLTPQELRARPESHPRGGGDPRRPGHGPLYDVVLDLATGPTTFATRSTVRFSATPGAETFVDFVGESVESVILNGTALDPAAVWTDSRIALPGLAAENELLVEATALYTNTGEGMHRFVDPVDGEVYLYSQFEVADSRRVFAVFEQPDLKATFAFTVTAPRTGRSAPSPTPSRARRRPRRHRARDVDLRADPGPLLLRHRARVRPLRGRHRHGPEPPRSGRARGTRVARWSSTSTPTTSSSSRRSASSSSSASSTLHTRSRSTTRSSRRSTTPGRWRTPAA